MQDPPVFLVSDIHLGAIPDEAAAAFVHWLERHAPAAAKLVINGDLFDFWFEYKTVIPRGHTRVLGALAALVDGGVPVVMTGGNHDWWGGSYLREEVGVQFHQDPVTLELQGRTTLLAHGDGLGSGDLGYRFLRLLLRSRPTRFAFRWLHPDVGAWVARKVSRTEARAGEPAEKQQVRSRFLEAWAVSYLQRFPEVDQVVLGHTHIPVIREVEAGRFYVNAGDWLVNRSFVVFERGRHPRLERWRAPG